jgi:predicted dehydrogenase
MSDIIRIGMVGTGGIARHHIGQITPIPNVQITALCDTNAEQIRHTTDCFGYLREVPVVEDYHDLLAREDVDAIVVCTPHTQHAQQMLDGIAANKHILMEKPLVCTVADAHTILERLKGYKKVVGIAYQRHAMGQFIYIHDKIASGELGPVTFISASQCQGWKRGTTGSWRQDPALSGGGQINDSGSHLLDIILWCTGLTVADVAAYIDNCGTPVDINSALSIRFTNGAQGNISVIGDSVVGWNEDISIWCDKGAFLYRNGTLSFVNEKGVKTTVDGESLPPSHNIDEDFVKAIRGEKEIAAPPICGLRTIELTEAAWRSAAQNGVPVKMN